MELISQYLRNCHGKSGSILVTEETNTISDGYALCIDGTEERMLQLLCNGTQEEPKYNFIS